MKLSTKPNTLVASLLLSVIVESVAGQDIHTTQLQVDDYRPLARAFYELRIKHGLTITYEEPRYLHESELEDVTASSPGAKSRFEKGLGLKLVAPRRGRLELSYPVATDGTPQDAAALIRELVDQHTAEGNPGRFELRQDEGVFHVVPTIETTSDRQHKALSPLMDTPISLDLERRSADQAVEDFVAALSKATGQEIVVGVLPLGFGQEKPTEVSADNESARNVLWRILNTGSHRLTWGLYYDPMTQSRMLNVSVVRAPSSLLEARRMAVTNQGLEEEPVAP